MRPYGQKRVYGKYITRTYRSSTSGKIHVTTLVKNHKRERHEAKTKLNNDIRSIGTYTILTLGAI